MFSNVLAILGNVELPRVAKRLRNQQVATIGNPLPPFFQGSNPAAPTIAPIDFQWVA
jgi:hypothetical protein